MSNNSSLSSKNKFQRFLAICLASTTLSQAMILPLLAEGTPAGETISNTATVEYEDDDGNTFDGSSNTVTVEVAKVHGITNVPNGFNIVLKGTGTNNNIVQTGDTVEFEFRVTNTGNDVANIFIPDLGNIATKGLDTNTLSITVEDESGTAITSYDPNSSDLVVDNVASGDSIIVKIEGNVTATAAGAPVEVQLGNTGSNDDPNNPLADTQNQPDDADTEGAVDEVYTSNSTNATVGGNPANGQREASSVNQVLLGANKRALAQIRKTNSGINDNGTGGDITDDSVTYNLELEVQQTTPNSLFTPADLEGRDFTGQIADGATSGVPGDLSNIILMADVIPENTTLDTTTNTPTAPPNWIVVYSGDDPTTTQADEASWNTDPSTITDIERIGYIYDARQTGGNNKIATGTIVTGFNFTVEIDGSVTADSLSIANIAQLFGSTDDGAAGVTDTGNIFDESGDPNPSNFNDDGSVGPDEDDPESDGVPDPANHGTDADNDNTGQGPGGEDNVIVVSQDGLILNGPDGFPGATGTVFATGPDNNHDFQNASAPTPGDPSPGDTYDPDPITLTNTLSNPGGSDLSDVLLQPIAPEDFSLGGTNTDLPNNTVVTVNFSGQIAEYTYDQTNGQFNLTDGTPIVIPTLASGVSADYTVQVDLPTNTPLSTDNADDNTRGTPGFPVPMIAFVDGDNDGSPDVGETANVTVDQVYTGFLKLIKQVRILDSEGNEREAYTDNPTVDPAPGDELHYRVIYRNISEPQTGSGNNTVLNAQNVVITENGTTADTNSDGQGDGPGNDWALDDDTDGNLDTLNVQNSANDSSTSSVINFLTGINAGTNVGTVDPGDAVTGYETIVPTVAPTGADSTPNSVDATLSTDDVEAGYQRFIFIREVNDQ